MAFKLKKHNHMCKLSCPAMFIVTVQCLSLPLAARNAKLYSLTTYRPLPFRGRDIS